MISSSLLISAALLGFFDDASDRAAKEELKRLQGTWKVLSAEQVGEKIDLKKLGIDRVVIKEDRMTFKLAGKDVAEFKIVIDPTTKPKSMDWNKEKTSLPSIYALEGKELRLCFPMLKNVPIPRPDRPKSFETKDKPLGNLVTEREE